jgi:hypothetical protein
MYPYLDLADAWMDDAHRRADQHRRSRLARRTRRNDRRRRRDGGRGPAQASRTPGRAMESGGM